MIRSDVAKTLLAASLAIGFALPLTADEPAKKEAEKAPAADMMKKDAGMMQKDGEKTAADAKMAGKGMLGDKSMMRKGMNAQRGTVKSIDAATRKLVIEARMGAGKTEDKEYMLPEKVSIKQRNEEKTIADIKVGDMVLLTMDADKKNVEMVRVIPKIMMDKMKSKAEAKGAMSLESVGSAAPKKDGGEMKKEAPAAKPAK